MDPQASLLSARDVHRVRSDVAQRPRGSRWILAAAAAWCRLEARAAHQADKRPHALLVRVIDSVQHLTGALWGTALSVEEKAWLTVRIYDDCPAFRAPGNELFAIESDVFKRRLPQAPSRILVGACGTGREAVALAAQGYRVDAFDPAEDCVAESGRRLGGQARVRRLSYEQLSEIVLDGAAIDPFGSNSFDAVVLGCGSLSHVLDEREQRRLMQALHALCPSGPIIASFLWIDDAAVPPIGRAMRLGGRIGRAIARLRGLTARDGGRLNYRARRGFAYTFTKHELEELALGIHRRVAWEPHAGRPSLYATFLPPDEASA
jgi:SAM-dependent methyltransferase